ncbi:hypothetical protein LCGC14_1888450 [marine sediment metagenome]|uniref:Uncharacterized protein n=1 Tax=marine sediment metagenome TaxID=412755 RepID=A0A0F9GNF9_9ZZZZ
MSHFRNPRRIMGFVDLGPIQIPPRPRKPALVDRVNGNTYELIKSGADPALSLLTDTSGFQVFAAHSGPYVAASGTTRKLFSSGGTLSSEEVAHDASWAPVLITVAESPLDVWEVVWDASTLALTLEELL